MNYRQWKKNYKKQHGYNPPTDKDARAAMKYLRRNIDSIMDTVQNIVKQLPSAIEKCKQIISEMTDEEFADFINEKLEDPGARAMALQIRMSGGGKA